MIDDIDISGAEGGGGAPGTDGPVRSIGEGGPKSPRAIRRTRTV
eukprot:CAMPEP_0205942500 /NCGR_PEP_ID=MMETSP1325-20131115/57761_1 /ASSEMBLY_ACC=CAM_ASM_000708 /TAXON_ID=236786 /ORGANISM="Florenciella sp., Strain RCC1007" /LENGTH=43 /DNA_ID= /DNA_START= /DNA_END= /DNA_ORIENTATION=